MAAGAEELILSANEIISSEIKKQIPMVEKGEIEIQKHMPFTLVSDERFCDGLYFALALREFKKIMKNPKLFETPLEKKVEDTE